MEETTFKDNKFLELINENLNKNKIKITETDNKIGKIPNNSLTEYNNKGDNNSTPINRI